MSFLIILILVHDGWPLLLWLPSPMGEPNPDKAKEVSAPLPPGDGEFCTQINLFAILQAMNRGTLSCFPQPTLDCAGLFRIWFVS